MCVFVGRTTCASCGHRFSLETSDRGCVGHNAEGNHCGCAAIWDSWYEQQKAFQAKQNAEAQSAGENRS